MSENKSKNYSQMNTHRRFNENYSDLHTRPFPILATPLRVSQISVLHEGPDNYQHELTHLNNLCLRYNINPPQQGDVCFYQNFGEFEVRWERHTEFSSYAFIVFGQDSQPFKHPPIALLPVDWVQNIPGKVIAAIHIEALDANTEAFERETMRQYFEGQRLIASALRHGAATIWSALRIHTDNFNRILLLNNNLNDCQSGRVLRTLLELEAYRNMMLLAFPLAQEVIPPKNNSAQK